jgi:hypothetical protein
MLASALIIIIAKRIAVRYTSHKLT